MDKIYSASCIANYFIENTKSIDNLRLNKFVYIAYGLALVYKERELFKDRIEAWEYGPVIPAIYHEFKKYKDKKIIEQSYILDQNEKKEFSFIDKKDKGAKEVLDAASKRDIMELQSTIAESKNSLEKIITKNKNDTDIKLKDIEKEIVSIKSNLEKKIVESKNVLLQWILGMITGYTILLIVVLRFFEK